MTAKRLSELNRLRRIQAYQRIRKELGVPEPTEHQRKLRRGRNERYRAKIAAQQQRNPPQSKAA